MLGLRMVEPLQPRGERFVWSVAGLVLAVSDAINARFSSCTLRGEISNLTRATSGHCYLSLKDAEGASVSLHCVMFSRVATMLDFEPFDGQLVEVRGRLSVYKQRGELQFIIETMRRAGEGAMFEKFLKLKARLEAEGLFDEARKRPLPAFTHRVGVVTSLAAAALADVLTALQRRAPHVEVVVYPCLVQGNEAPATLVRAIETASQRAEVDVLIVCRGGGSLEDLWSFNDERVVRAIVAARMPVVCGVGHETDVTLADFAADLRAPTPTAAAELSAPKRSDQIELLAGMGVLLKRFMQRHFDLRKQMLERVVQHLTRPRNEFRMRVRMLEQTRQRLVSCAMQFVPQQAHRSLEWRARLSRAAQVGLSSRKHRLTMLEGRLQGVDPHQVLTRGFAWITDEDGRAITSAEQLSAGQQIRAVLNDGEASATVDKVDLKR